MAAAATDSASEPKLNDSKFTASEAARYLGVSLATVRRWADAGELPHWRTPCGQRRFDRAELDRWLKARQR